MSDHHIFRRTYAFFVGLLSFIFFAFIFYQIGTWAPFLWTSPEEISEFSDEEKLSLRNTQSAIQLVGIFLAAWISGRSYKKTLKTEKTQTK